MATLRASQAFRGHAFTLIAVESVELGHGRTDFGCRLHGKVEPVAVVVCGPHGVYALDMEARPTDLEQLIQSVPALGALVAAVDHERS